MEGHIDLSPYLAHFLFIFSSGWTPKYMVHCWSWWLARGSTALAFCCVLSNAASLHFNLLGSCHCCCCDFFVPPLLGSRSLSSLSSDFPNSPRTYTLLRNVASSFLTCCLPQTTILFTRFWELKKDIEVHQLPKTIRSIGKYCSII